MNIKNRHINLMALSIVMPVLALIAVLSINIQSVGAEPSQSDPVVVYCVNKAKKAKAKCPAAVEDARNKASWNCDKKEGKPDYQAECIQTKAQGYIKLAAEGNPGEQKFMEQLDAVLDKVSGDRNKSNPDAGALPAGSATGSFWGSVERNPDRQCGNNKDTDKNAYTKFNFGCIGPDGPDGMSPIEDLLYALIRFLSAGVGIVIVLAIVMAGIQYSSSEGNPEATQSAKNKIRDAVVGLIIYLFAFSLVQFLVPGGAFAGSLVTAESSALTLILELK